MCLNWIYYIINYSRNRSDRVINAITNIVIICTVAHCRFRNIANCTSKSNRVVPFKRDRFPQNQLPTYNLNNRPRPESMCFSKSRDSTSQPKNIHLPPHKEHTRKTIIENHLDNRHLFQLPQFLRGDDPRRNGTKRPIIRNRRIELSCDGKKCTQSRLRTGFSHCSTVWNDSQGWFRAMTDCARSMGVFPVSQ